ncbi:unnamed protein product [Dibothriocephalus latus]|uniref:Uncharacterized protein n=1 Tax=Dibothriocephalus latus TaxID=60516 RepID=A0A3P7LQV9_DIBLA|nr:unnamed protein product [Dibothriocephalus latus]
MTRQLAAHVMVTHRGTFGIIEHECAARFSSNEPRNLRTVVIFPHCCPVSGSSRLEQSFSSTDAVGPDPIDDYRCFSPWH